jgi:hypothetical protein
MLTKFLKNLALVFVLVFCAELGVSQSNDQNSPTPLTTNEIKGEIKARAIGDSRTTTYYFVFSGKRGDVFINVVTSNLNGTIDLFSLNGLKPRTKITLFADNPESETGRVVYMRQSERLLLRIQGRTPNDDPATFLIKFAGSFSPVSAADYDDTSPTVGSGTEGSVRVNSAGTIIEDLNAKANRDVDEKIAVKSGESLDSPGKKTQTERTDTKDAKTIAGNVGIEEADNPELNKAETPVTQKIVKPKISSAPTAVSPKVTDKSNAVSASNTKEITVGVGRVKPKRSALVTISRSKEKGVSEPTLEEKLAKVNLQLILKSGTVFTRPMNEVISVNVIKGILTIVTSEGKIIEFSILEVLKMTIE